MHHSFPIAVTNLDRERDVKGVREQYDSLPNFIAVQASAKLMALVKKNNVTRILIAGWPPFSAILFKFKKGKIEICRLLWQR